MSQRFANTIAVGDILGERYEIIQVLGQGGMGTVFKAMHLSLNKPVAVKALHPHIVLDQNALARFQQEIKAMSMLSHPHLISVSDVGTSSGGTPYFVMEFLDGPSLGDLLRNQGPIPEVRAVRMFVQMSDALAYAHDQGIIHRDLKPSNVVVLSSNRNKDFIKLVDLGIAKLLTPSGGDQLGLTTTGEIFGSPLYMSPEQCLGQPVDARSDIYSLGCLMFETLCGEPPIKGGSALETFNLHVNTVAPLISTNPRLRMTPALQMLESVIAKCMEKRPVDRFQSMADLAHVLENIDRQAPNMQLSERGGGVAIGGNAESAHPVAAKRVAAPAPSNSEAAGLTRSVNRAHPLDRSDSNASAGEQDNRSKILSLLLNKNAFAGIGTFAVVMILYFTFSPMLIHRAPPGVPGNNESMQNFQVPKVIQVPVPSVNWQHYSVSSKAPASKTKVDVVAVYAGEGQESDNFEFPGNVEVRVGDAGKPIALVLVSYCATNWKIVRENPFVNIERVMVSSYRAPVTVTGVPAGVPIEKAWYPGFTEDGRPSTERRKNPYEIFPMVLTNDTADVEDTGDYKKMKEIVEGHLHAPVQSFQGCYREGHFRVQ